MGHPCKGHIGLYQKAGTACSMTKKLPRKTEAKVHHKIVTILFVKCKVLVKVDLGVARDVQKKAKHTLFHSIKFLKSEDEFEDLSNDKTFGRHVLEQFALEEDEI